MKNYIKSILILTMVLLVSCTSGQNSPVDSHPSSGSVKAGREDKEEAKKDTTINTTTDTLTNKDKKP
jgi:hypothetical protein